MPDTNGQAASSQRNTRRRIILACVVCLACLALSWLLLRHGKMTALSPDGAYTVTVRNPSIGQLVLRALTPWQAKWPAELMLQVEEHPSGDVTRTHVGSQSIWGLGDDVPEAVLWHPDSRSFLMVATTYTDIGPWTRQGAYEVQTSPLRLESPTSYAWEAEVWAHALMTEEPRERRSAQRLFEAMTEQPSEKLVPCWRIHQTGPDGEPRDPVIPTTYIPRGEEPPAAEQDWEWTSVTLRWDVAALHIAADVADDDHAPPTEEGRLHDGDSVWIAVGPPPCGPQDGTQRPIRTYAIARRGDDLTVYDVGWATGEPRLEPAAGALTVPLGEEGGAPPYAVTVPWTELGFDAAPEEGDALGFAMTVIDVDADGSESRRTYFGDATAPPAPSTFGQLILFGEPHEGR